MSDVQSASISPFLVTLSPGEWLSNPNRSSTRKFCASRCGPFKDHRHLDAETRLYHKGSPQNAYECFETVRLASDPALLKRFVFLLGAERVVPAHRDCHLYELLHTSESVGRELTNQFYAL